VSTEATVLCSFCGNRHTVRQDDLFSVVEEAMQIRPQRNGRLLPEETARLATVRRVRRVRRVSGSTD
jgi:hypothetical protein